MLDQASFAIWGTDLVLLALAYLVGRIHGGIILREFYSQKLERMLNEIKLMQRKVDHLNDLYIAVLHDRGIDAEVLRS